MKITYIVFISTCLVLQSFGEGDSKGSTISSSYAYRIEYDDSDNGNFGHKIEVKDKSARVNVRSENAKKFNTAVATKTGKPYLPQKRPVVFEKPKEEITYVAAESSTVAPSLKNTQQYSAPQVQPQPQNNPAIESALQKYSRDQLAILLSQNKNPFLPLDPKDSINKFISKYVSPQQSHPPSIPQSQPSADYASKVPSQYQTQSYAQSPVESPHFKSQYPSTYYTPSVPQQNSQVQQYYHQPQIQQSFSQPAPYNNLQQTAGYPKPVPATQEAVQYVYVPQSSPQTASHPGSSTHSSVAPQVQTESYGYAPTGPVQFSQQNYQPVTTKQQYIPSSSTYQTAQYENSIPKSVSYPAYSQPVQTNAYSTSSSNGYASSIHQAADQGKQQYQYVPSSTYQNNHAIYNNIPKASTQISQSKANYQSVYGSPAASHYPSTVPSPQYESNVASYKPTSQGAPQLNQGNFDFSKYFQYVPTQNQAPTVAYKQSEARVQSASNTGSYLSEPTTQGATQFSQGKFDFSKFAQYIPTKNQASHVTYKQSEPGVQHTSNTGQYFSGASTQGTTHLSQGKFDFSKYTPTENQASSAAYKPSEAGVQFTSNTGHYFPGPTTQGATHLSQSNLDFSKFAQYIPTKNEGPSVAYKPSEAGVQLNSNTGHYFSGPLPQGETHMSQGNFDFSKFAQYIPTNKQTPSVSYKPSEAGTQLISNTGHYNSGLSTSQNANYASAGTTLSDSSKTNQYPSNINAGHNLFAGLQSSNYGSLFSGVSGSTGPDASKYLSSQPTQSDASAYGSNIGTNVYAQFGNQATPSSHYKPTVENSAPINNVQLQYQSPNINSGNYDNNKFQSHGGNVVPNGHSFNLNQISNVQASDSKYGQYAIDIKQGTNPNGAAQVMVQTNYNLGAQNVQPSHSSSPAASDNSNIKYVYVPSYSPNSPEGANHGK